MSPFRKVGAFFVSSELLTKENAEEVLNGKTHTNTSTNNEHDCLAV